MEKGYYNIANKLLKILEEESQSTIKMEKGYYKKQRRLIMHRDI